MWTVSEEISSMLKMFRYIFWLVALLIAAVALDQVMTKVPLDTPGLRESQSFYVDFRSRLIDLFDLPGQQPVDGIQSVIDKTARPPDRPPESRDQRYFYVDRDGALQFVDGWQDIPREYRDAAQPLAD